MNSTLLTEAISPDTPPPVMISVMGPFRLMLYGELAPINSGSKSERLLTHLALNREHRVERAGILDYLWPNQDPTLAGQSLNSLTYQLNKFARACLKQRPLISNDNGYYYLNMSADVGVDIDYFDTWRVQGKCLLDTGEDEKGIAYYQQALTLYRGDLCCDPSTHTLIERERLRTAFLNLLASLADYAFSHGDPTKALAYINQLLRHDPCREDAYRQAMRCYVQLGQRAQAFRQYELCCQILMAEFDTSPEPATEALFNQIRLNPASIQPLSSPSDPFFSQTSA